MKDFIRKAGVLVEAIPYIHAFRKKVFVIKYGGSILENDEIRRNIFQDIVFLSYVGIRTILVHGGGPHISSRLKEAGIETIFHDGIRVTDEKTLKIVGEELQKLNKRIVKEIKAAKGDVTGLKGQDNIVIVKKKKAAKELGYVGTIREVKKQIIEEHLHRGHITVLSPMGICEANQPHNVNADEVASAIAVSMKAEKLVYFSDVPGVLANPVEPSSLISTLTEKEIEKLKEQNIISKGMIPKLQSCVEAVKGKVKKAHIIDARIKHALLLEIFTDQGIGTQIINDE